MNRTFKSRNNIRKLNTKELNGIPNNVEVDYLDGVNNSKIQYYNVENNCTEKDGKYYYIDASKLNKHIFDIYQPIINDVDLTTNELYENGTYTYVIGSSADGKVHLFCMKLLTVNEIGTKHSKIVERLLLDNIKIHYAGEFVKNKQSNHKFEKVYSNINKT